MIEMSHNASPLCLNTMWMHDDNICFHFRGCLLRVSFIDTIENQLNVAQKKVVQQPRLRGHNMETEGLICMFK